MVSDAVLVTLKFLHVLLAATWVGMGVLAAFVLGPVIRRASAPTRREFTGRYAPVAFRVGNAVGGLTLLSGLALVWAVYGDFRFSGSSGKLILYGLFANLLALLVGNFVIRPSFRAMQALMADEDPTLPPPGQVVFLQRRLAFNQVFVLFLLLSAVLAMVMANQGVEV
jgi:hypothetical protein